MHNNFSPSIHLLRDADKAIRYIPTSNTKRIVQQMINDYKIGIHAFTLIGSYGTGKSAFLLAFEQNLKGLRRDFDDLNGQFGSVNGFEFWNIIGEYQSLLSSLARSVEAAPDPRQLMPAIERRYQACTQQQRGLVIVLDEFGKFLEYAAAHNPEQELYFIQQLAEYANDERKNILFVTVLHQGFNAYARGLDVTQRQEWEKVKGRLKELTFNEPVELLLNLAAEHLESSSERGSEQAHQAELFTAITSSKTFPHRSELTDDLARKLAPFDPLAAAILTFSLQQYGQNERSLFTFLNSYDRFGLKDYDAAHNPYYNLACVHDYLLHNYYSLLSTKYNPHYTQWAAIRRAIERVDGTFKEYAAEAAHVVKTVGLLNIFASVNARIDTEFLESYAKWSLGVDNPENVVKKLETLKIIRFVVFKQRFILFEGTDLDFELASLDAATKVDAVKDVVTPLKKYFEFPYLLAKAISYKQGTPRFFAFHLSEKPLDTPPQGEIDGIINLVFDEHLSLTDLQAFSAHVNQAILYGLYHTTRQIRDLLFEIKKTEYVIANNRDDRVAVEELQALKAHQIEELNGYVLHQLYSHSEDVTWVFAGEVQPVASITAFNMLLSRICERMYPDAPTFKNELVNRHKLSGAIATARRNYLKALTGHWDQADLGFPPDKFPPEKMIYLTLLQQTGMHHPTEDETSYVLERPILTFNTLWQVCEHFLENAKPVQQNVQELVKILSEPPLKLKQGLIDFWLPTFLFIKREEFALYHEGVYLPELTHENLDLILKKPQQFYLKTFDVQGVKLNLFNKYRTLAQQSADMPFTTTTFIETVKPFLTFYRSLPEYAKRTTRLEQSALRLREVIATATDPEKTFFEDFPRALGYGHLELKDLDETHLKDFIYQLKTAIRELQTCFSELVGRIETHLLRELGCVNTVFPAYRPEIEERYRSLKDHLLLPHQQVFYTRLRSPLDDRDAWIGSLVHAVLHKRITEMLDEEEAVVFDRLSNAIRELNNLCDISKLVTDPAKEQVVKVEVTTYAQGSQEELVRLPKQKAPVESALTTELEKILLTSKDKTVKIAVLVKLLQKELQT